MYILTHVSRAELGAHAVEDLGFGHLDTGIAGSNPARGMDVCPRFSVSCCCAWVETLRRPVTRPWSPAKRRK
jgi:hypothetical protein